MTAKKKGHGTHKSKYGRGAQKTIKKEMHDFKHGKAKSGTGGKKVTSRKQAVAIGIAKARKKGQKTPAKKTAGK
ncbi:DUF6496 domain-containing protein [Candidatus Berkiella aquae]|uniref:Uncharacterized protein n=1 Tax=Candidatus Berkiella aquae TaxID=295108 RepID=A0A0Q9YXJ9_9GAMM|nr:DUF6496 domain-containing protein [Candidatus Berkiella aquae]MCS5711606.1 hypothetical protein [Candidatus Berkiella aquae]